MEMTFEQYTSKMFAILETALYNYEIDTLVEAADAEDGALVNVENNEKKKESRFGALKNVATKVFSKIWEAIIAAWKWVLDRINELKNKPVVVREDIVVLKGAVEFDANIMRYATEIQKGDVSLCSEAEDYIKKLGHVTYKAGETVNTAKLAGIAKKYMAAAAKCSSSAEVLHGDSKSMRRISQTLRTISNKLTEMYKGAHKLLAFKEIADKEADDAKVYEKIGKKRDNLKAKAEKMDAKINAKAHAQAMKERVKNESVDTDDITLSARLILEAANLLREDADDYVDGIDGGEVLYKEIDDIPEETPVSTGEYDEDVNGGEGEKIDFEEIKDLVDGDSEAIAVLTDDEGGKAITESVVIRF